MAMTAPFFDSQPQYVAASDRPARWMRWSLLLAVSMLLHIAVLTLADRGVGMQPAAPTATRTMTAILTPAPAVAPAVVPTSPASPTVAPVASVQPLPPQKPRRVQPRPKAVAAIVIPEPAVKMTASNETATDPVSTATAAAASDAPTEAPPGSETASATQNDAAAGVAPAAKTDLASGAAPTGNPADRALPGAGPVQPRYKVSLPPSVTLTYEVRYSTRGNITRGNSVISWRAEQASYAIQGEVTKFGFALSSFRSEGGIDDAGIAPTLYAEKNARRNETTTQFSRDARQAISFSAATGTFPLVPGAQDRGSILWQLSGIARGDRAVFVPGGVLDIVVAGVRDAEHWIIEIVGEETVLLDTGEARAWHLVKTARAGTSDKRIDIWLAPERQWYPVKLRYTEASGDYLDLSLSDMR